ncbi:MAG: EscU/YscU/HrcU family type III secretion system export apparatus switch protein [Oscillospiraceae bacterium]|nr:EscU/YscU/HrcU family type III secretion system export apparatus switch protein [Oscillospiraceae bacterium]
MDEDGSDKIITRAAAISYDPEEDNVPILSAFGEGYLAKKIVEVAKGSGIPVLADPSLSSVLSKVSVGDEIAPELYEAVAKILAYVGEINQKYGEKIRLNDKH